MVCYVVCFAAKPGEHDDKVDALQQEDISDVLLERPPISAL